jgi:hypothetical protein
MMFPRGENKLIKHIHGQTAKQFQAPARKKNPFVLFYFMAGLD